MKAAALLLLLAAVTGAVGARVDDFGTQAAVRAVREDARILLAHRLRQAHADLRTLVLCDAAVLDDNALVSWTAGPRRGLIGLARYGDRWWDAFNRDSPGAGCRRIGPRNLLAAGFSAPSAQSATLPPPFRAAISPLGGSFDVPRQMTAGYGISLAYTQNDAPSGAGVSQIYARPPTPAEFLPFPTPWHPTSDAVAYVDLTIAAAKPVTFQPGTTVDVWFPFVLDDRLRYSFSMGFADKPIGPIYGTIFDNVLHFALPAFTAIPAKTLMAEIDGDPYSSSP